MKRILWISKNVPLPTQVNELKRLFGEDLILDLDPKPFSSANDIMRRYKRGGYDEMVLIAPLSVCRILTDAGYKPLYSEMISSKPSESEVKVCNTRERINSSNRFYKFVKFKRLESIQITYSELDT